MASGGGAEAGDGFSCAGAREAGLATALACMAEVAPVAGSRVTVLSGNVMVALLLGGGDWEEGTFGGFDVAGFCDGTAARGCCASDVGEDFGAAVEGVEPGRVGLPGTTTGRPRVPVAGLGVEGALAGAAGGALAAAFPLRDGALERAAAACCRADGCLPGLRGATGGVVCCCWGGGGVGGFCVGASAEAVCGKDLVGTPAAAAADALNLARVLRYSCRRTELNVLRLHRTSVQERVEYDTKFKHLDNIETYATDLIKIHRVADAPGRSSLRFDLGL